MRGVNPDTAQSISGACVVPALRCSGQAMSRNPQKRHRERSADQDNAGRVGGIDTARALLRHQSISFHAATPVARALATSGDMSEALIAPPVTDSIFRASSGGQSTESRSCESLPCVIFIASQTSARFSDPGRSKYDLMMLMGVNLKRAKPERQCEIITLAKK